jgi:hypothetical protein
VIHKKTASPKNVGGLGDPSYFDSNESVYDAILVGVYTSLAYYFNPPQRLPAHSPHSSQPSQSTVREAVRTEKRGGRRQYRYSISTRGTEGAAD